MALTSKDRSRPKGLTGASMLLVRVPERQVGSDLVADELFLGIERIEWR